MEVAQIWRSFFHEWPSGMKHTGVVLTSFGETVPFLDYVASDTLVVLERRTPDTVGGRRVVLPYERIDAIKIVDPITTDVLTASGFRKPSAK